MSGVHFLYGKRCARTQINSTERFEHVQRRLQLPAGILSNWEVRCVQETTALCRTPQHSYCRKSLSVRTFATVVGLLEPLRHRGDWWKQRILTELGSWIQSAYPLSPEESDSSIESAKSIHLTEFGTRRIEWQSSRSALTEIRNSQQTGRPTRSVPKDGRTR